MIRKLFYYLKIYGLTRTFLYTLDLIRLTSRSLFLNSHTPYGEDIIIDKLLEWKKKGFYVDVGAYDPSRFSNTKRFYLKGWQGINIEPNPENIAKFYKERPRDRNLNIGIADRTGIRKFYVFEPSSLSTFDSNVAKNYRRLGFKVFKIHKVKVLRLASVLARYCNRRNIDFLNIDTEGLDFQVLKSNNWKKFRPKVICLEIPSLSNPNESNPDRKLGSATKRFFSRLGYKMAARTISNAFFVR